MRPTQMRPVALPTKTPLPQDDQTIKTADGPHDFCLGVEFPPGLSLGRVETVRVELFPVDPIDRVVDLGAPLLPEPLPVRLVVPGALVMPSEQSIHPSPFEAAEVVFHVTPLVAGLLPRARVEMLRGKKIESLEMSMCGHGHTLPRILALLTLVVPLLLHLTTSYADAIAAGSVQRHVLAWLPGLPFRESVATLAQRWVGFLATTGRDGHFSFLAFVGLMTAWLCVSLLRRPGRRTLWGAEFPLGPAPKSMGPPSYLTPVSAPDIGNLPPQMR